MMFCIQPYKRLVQVPSQGPQHQSDQPRRRVFLSAWHSQASRLVVLTSIASCYHTHNPRPRLSLIVNLMAKTRCFLPIYQPSSPPTQCLKDKPHPTFVSVNSLPCGREYHQSTRNEKRFKSNENSRTPMSWFRVKSVRPLYVQKCNTPCDGPLPGQGEFTRFPLASASA
jgi:hypothetical protein